MDTLETIAAKMPYPDYQNWWPIGDRFLEMMQKAIVQTWQEAWGEKGAPAKLVHESTGRYIRTVYHRDARPELVDQFIDPPPEFTVLSGEFDALSYAFFRSAFHAIRLRRQPAELHAFTQIVGQRFFSSLSEALSLQIPKKLSSRSEFAALARCIDRVGDFLVAQGYLRDSFDFTFDVTINHQGSQIHQSNENALGSLLERGLAFALYRMGYPAILPSAVYLYHTMGEAQHHSSRTIEELFSRAGCLASETPDFDPTGFPANEVVELWEIRQKPFGA